MAGYKSIDEEVAAAEAALKSAQDRLEAARAKQAQAAAGVYVDDTTSGASEHTAQHGAPEYAAQYGGPEYANVGASTQASWENSPQQGGIWQSGAQQSGTVGFSSGNGRTHGASNFQVPPYSQVNGQTYRTAHSQEGSQAAPYAQSAPQTKDHVAAGLLAIFLGCLGIHKFYLGYNTPGFIMLAITVIGSIFSLGIAGAVMLVISIVEGVIYLSKSQTDFERIYVFGNKEWF